MNDPTEVTVCRTCLSECSTYSRLHKEGIILGEVTSLAALLKYALCLEMTDDARLPSIICGKCVQLVAKCYIFKKTILESNDELEKQSEQLVIGDGASDGVDTADITLSTNAEDTETECSSVVVEHQHHVEAEELEELANAAQLKRTMDKMEYEMQLMHDTEEEIEIVEECETQTTKRSRRHSNDNDRLVIQETEEEEEVVIPDDGDDDEVGEEVETATNGDEVDGGEVVIYDNDDDNTIYLDSVDDKEYMIEQDEDEECSETYEVVTLDDGIGEGEHVEVLKKANKTSSTGDEDGKAVDDGKGRKGERNRRAKKPPNPDFKCKVCQKQLSNHNSFKYHMQLHSDVTPYLCSLCGEGFKTRNAYDGHIVLHDPNNPNTCHLCGKQYRQSSSLRTHMMRHTGERPFKCNVCGKGLTQKSGYKKHMLTHTGEKPHVCDICNRKFRYSSNLLAHRRCHSGEKPYECPECEKGFPTHEQMKRHRLVHTEHRPYSCEVCEKRFKRRASLLVHRSVHETMPPTVEHKISKSNVVELY